MISILLPHLRQDENNKALAICLSCLAANTGVNYELIVEGVAERRDIYSVVNAMAARATQPYIVLMNSDHFVAPGWIEPILGVCAPDVMASGVLVECGAIGVHHMNYPADFGRTPATFRRDDFETFARHTDAWVNNDGWFWPVVMTRNSFLNMGGFDTSNGGFPAPLDFQFAERWKERGGRFARARGYIYHLQNYSNPDEQTKEGRLS